LLQVFICYGGREGEEIGAGLRDYLRSQGIEAFLASPRSPDVPAGVDYETFIDARLLSSNLIVPICDSGIHRSEPALREICLALDESIPIVAFIKKRCKLPNLIRKTWAPIRFDPQAPQSAYLRLLVEIYRRIDYEREQSEDLRMTRPTEMPIFSGLKRLFRGR